MKRLIGTTLKALILAPVIVWSAQVGTSSAEEAAKAEEAGKTEDTAKDSATQATQRTGTLPPATTPKTTADTASDTFVPSEEISEDLSVSYPVDI